VILHETVTTSDYWTDEEKTLDIATREALALDKALASFPVNAWSNQGGRSASLNKMIKKLFFTTAQLNISLHIRYVASSENPADEPSRCLSVLDSKLHLDVWGVVQREFGGSTGHTCDLIALDSNVICDLHGNPLPHFSSLALALSGIELSEVMDHVGWTQRHTGLYYLQLAKVLKVHLTLKIFFRQINPVIIWSILSQKVFELV